MRNTNLLKTYQIFVLVLLFLFSSGVCAAQESVELVQRPDTEFLILGLDVNGVLRSDGIEAYLPDGESPKNVLIPLGSLARTLSVAIETNPAEGMAEGFFLSKDNIFQLDMVNERVISADQTYVLEENAAEAHADDIYVRAQNLEKWFGFSANLESSSLTFYIKSDYVFPFQEAEERRRKAEKLLTKSRREDFDPKEAYLLPYGFFSAPKLLLQQSALATSAQSDKTYQSVTNVQAGFDFMKFGADLNLTHAANNKGQNEITNARMTLSRSDPKQEMLGFLNAGRIDIGDVNFPSVPLFGGAQRGAGVRVSSDAAFGFRFSQQLGNITIDGDVPVNWNVELYRNGQFIDFQTIGNDARFIFEDVTLISGFNRFQILLFGPEGQKETITRDIFSGPNMLSEGKVRYNFAAGMPQADFLPITRDPRDDTSLGASGDILYGVNDFLTLGGSFYKGPVDEDDADVVGFSAASALLGFNAQAQALYADGNRTAVQGALRKRFLGVNTSISHTIFNNFEEEDQDLETSTEISFSRNFGGLNVTLIGERETFVDGEDRDTIENIVSSNLFGVKFTNQLVKTISDNDAVDDLEGELSAFTQIDDIRLRSSLSYDLDQDATDNLKTLRLSAQKRLREYDSIQLTSTYDFPTNIVSADVKYSHEFGPVTLDLDLGANNDDTYFAGVTVRSSLQPSDDGYEFVQPRIGSLANLGVRAFIDENANERFDIGEQIIEDILFKTSRGEVEGLTGNNGIATMYGLAETPTRIYVSQEDIPSIYLQPSTKGLDLIPRRGAKYVADFPFTQLGEVDGFVLSRIDGSPLSNVPVKIIDAQSGEEIAQVESEYDGYFIFSALPLGSYKILASQSWFEEGNSDTDARMVNLSVEEPYKLDVNLQVDPLDLQDLAQAEQVDMDLDSEIIP